MTPFEKDLEYANKILLIRDSLMNGEILKINSVRIFKRNAYCNEYHFLEKNSVFAYLEVRTDGGSSFFGEERIIYNPDTYYFNMPFSQNTYRFNDDPMDEAWYFQRSTLVDDNVLRATVLAKTLHSKPMGNFQYFSLHTSYIDDIINQLK